MARQFTGRNRQLAGQRGRPRGRQSAAGVGRDRQGCRRIPSLWSGTIARRFGAKGDVIKVGDALVEFSEQAGADTGTIVGGEGAPLRAEAPSRAQGLQVLPAIRALARKLEIDLNLVQGSARADVERAAKSLTEAGPAEPLKGIRRAMAQRMALAHAEIVPTKVTDEVDIDAWSKDADITIRLVQAIAAACKAEPSLNAWFNSEAGERRLLRRIDVGIAVDLEGGLIVPAARGGRRGCASDSPRVAVVADLRSPRRDRRRSHTLPRRAQIEPCQALRPDLQLSVGSAPIVGSCYL